MRIATWNVNSLKVRLPHVVDWLATADVDVLGLQELKLTDDKYPHAELKALGYESVVSGQKTYNGVALLSRLPMSDISMGMPDYSDEQKRVIAATVNGVRVVNAYFPNGQSLESDKYRYKLDWLDAMNGYMADELKRHEHLTLVGDYNIAPTDNDVKNPAEWVGQVLVSEPERAAFKALIAQGFADCFHRFPQPEKSFSWWDYRMMAFRRNNGARIDHILASPKLAEACIACVIDKEPRKKEQPSDHAPVVADFTI